MEDLVMVKGDARQLPLEDRTVQCVVTSPPYWGLRRYAGEQEVEWESPVMALSDALLCEIDGHVMVDGGREVEIRIGLGMEELSAGYRGGGKKQGKVGHFTAGGSRCARCGMWKGAFGLEPTVEMYVQHTVEVLREIRRVLREDGVVFWNLGDSYCSGAFSVRPASKRGTDVGGWVTEANQIQRNGRTDGLKPKDLCLIPARVALAAQADGWYVRSMIIWDKKNPMPESVVDRPTDSYEYVLMLTKAEKYFWDGEAVREAVSLGTHLRVSQNVAGQRGSDRVPGKTNGRMKAVVAGVNPKSLVNKPGSRVKQNESFSAAVSGPGFVTRNMRNVWSFATQSYSEAHFATFPEELPRRCILAATSSYGACSKCGAPWERIVRVTGGTIGKSWLNHELDLEEGMGQANGAEIRNGLSNYRRETVGWRPTCACGGGTIRKAACFSLRLERQWYRERWQKRIEGRWPGREGCLVLDPFAGSGTTGRVAIELNRRAVLNDLAYQELAEKRTSKVQRKLF